MNKRAEATTQMLIPLRDGFGFELMTWLQINGDRVYHIKDDNGAVTLTKFQMIQCVSSWLLDHNKRAAAGEI